MYNFYTSIFTIEHVWKKARQGEELVGNFFLNPKRKTVFINQHNQPYPTTAHTLSTYLPTYPKKRTNGSKIGIANSTILVQY